MIVLYVIDTQQSKGIPVLFTKQETLDGFEPSTQTPQQSYLTQRLRAKASSTASRVEKKKQAEGSKKKKTTTSKSKKPQSEDSLPPDVAPPGLFCGPADLSQALDEISSATEISLDLETTALTPWAAPAAPGKATKVGNGMTCNAYATRYKTAFDATARARILSCAALPAGRSFAFDFDLLDTAQKETLVRALHGKVWVGHNLAFDLMWLRSIAPDVQPRAWVDTMLLSNCIAPDFEHDVRDVLGSPAAPARFCEGGQCAHYGMSGTLSFSSRARAEMMQMLIARDARSRAGGDNEGRMLPLDFLSVALLGEKLDKSYQKPHNWMPGVLTTGHHDYCVGDITQPPKIARILLNLPLNAPINTVLQAIKDHPGGAAYRRFMRAAWRLSQMQRTGIYMSREKTLAYADKNIAQAEAALEKLLKDLPGLRAFRDDLADPEKGLSSELKHAFAKALQEATGVAPEFTETGEPKLDAKALKMIYRDLPALAHYNELTSALKRAAMARAYLKSTDEHSRLHPLVSISTVTGRTASQEPNLQNAPRGQDFRELFAAPPGKKIVAVDYSAVEMRIAAALAMRAYRDFWSVVDLACTGQTARYKAAVSSLGLLWFVGEPDKENSDGTISAIDAILYLLREGQDHPDAIICAGERPVLDGSSIDDWRAYFAGMLYEIVSKMHGAGAFSGNPDSDRLTLVEVFKNGHDPHIITALSTEARAGRFDLRGMSPIDFVSALSKDEAEALKKQLKAPRQSAKVQNFGLLYGMQAVKLHSYGVTNYGLSWAVEDAEFATQAWFDLYPEIRLWHLLTRSRKSKLFVDTTETKKLFHASTLSGRPVVSEQLPAALNFQDQGSGAEIALSAIAALPQHLASEFVNFVHDELVFEVPAELADERAKEIESVMIRAADELLLPWGVPTEVEAAIGDFWVH